MKPPRRRTKSSSQTKLVIKQPRERREEILQAALVLYFATVVPAGAAILFAVPNGEYRDPQTAVKLAGRAIDDLAPDDVYLVPAGQGVLSGATDLVLLLSKARVVLIEVKAPKVAATAFSPAKDAGRLSKSQRIFQAAATALGHHHVVIDSVDEFDRLLRDVGLRLRKPLIPEAFGITTRRD